MSEQRKPDILLIAKKRGKQRVRFELFDSTQWLELFDSTQWPYSRRMFGRFANHGRGRYRVRRNGRWLPGTTTLSDLAQQLRKYLKTRQPPLTTEPKTVE